LNNEQSTYKLLVKKLKIETKLKYRNQTAHAVTKLKYRNQTADALIHGHGEGQLNWIQN